MNVVFSPVEKDCIHSGMSLQKGAFIVCYDFSCTANSGHRKFCKGGILYIIMILYNVIKPIGNRVKNINSKCVLERILRIAARLACDHYSFDTKSMSF